MKPICAPLVRVLNGLVVELYFPEEVHACLRQGFGRQGAGLRLFDLVAQAALPEATRLQTLRTKFEEIHDTTHPLRQALEKLQTLETVRIIEGKA